MCAPRHQHESVNRTRLYHWNPAADSEASWSRAQFSIQEAFSYFDPIGICSFLHPVCFPRGFIVLFGTEIAQCKKPIAGS